jgi:hypothetical protein
VFSIHVKNERRKNEEKEKEEKTIESRGEMSIKNGITV